MTSFRQLMFGLLITVIASSRALAVCGDVDANTVITASDALATLNAAVGIPAVIDCSCDTCVDAAVDRAPRYCADVDGNAEMTASDALALLVAAVGGQVSLSCSCDACSASAITTTSTLPQCLTDGALDGRIFNRKARCRQSTFPCTPGFVIVTDVIEFNHLGGDSYEVRSVPDGDLLHVGTLSCNEFTGSTFQEFGTWTFQGDAYFSGGSFSCRYTGAESPTVPLDPPPVRCPLEP